MIYIFGSLLVSLLGLLILIDLLTRFDGSLAWPGFIEYISGVVLLSLLDYYFIATDSYGIGILMLV